MLKLPEQTKGVRRLRFLLFGQVAVGGLSMASMDVQGLEILSGQHAASPDHQTAKTNLSRLRRRAETAGDHQRARPHHLAQTTGALGNARATMMLLRASKTRNFQSLSTALAKNVYTATANSTTNNQITNRLTKRTSVRKHRKRRFVLEIARHLPSSGGCLNETATSIEPKP